jgi:HD superfamily phosphodiesterase
MITSSIMNRIKRHAVSMDWDVAFGGKAKGNQHLSRVVTIAQFLAEKEEASSEICAAGAWLHDVSLIAGNDDNPVRVRAVAEEYLSGLPLNDESKRRIAECVETHEGAGEAVSLEAKIVHDADALDKMGLLGVIRHTWKIVNLIKPEAGADEVFSILQKHLKERRERLYTTTAKKLVRSLNEALREFFEDKTKAIEMLETIMQLAKAGTISDEIAKELLLKADSQSLAFQLQISRNVLQSWYVQGEMRSAPEQELLLQGN